MDECEAAAARARLPGGHPALLHPRRLGLRHRPRTRSDLRRIAGAGLDASPVTEVLLEESILGWKEFELELMRDRHDNVVVVCSIENIDPMGVHTGDSVTVAPAMTLTDREYQHMRDVAIAVIRAVGVDTGGCNIQFAVHPQTGRMVVIEMNPRVSRSSALASKATGFPIAKIAARLAIGYTLDEIRNDITGETPASFEPALDYVVVKVPRFAFEKFPGADPVLTTHMKSVGEAMAIGRSFPEALQKALRSLESRGAPLSWARGRPATAAELLAAVRGPARRPAGHGAPGDPGRGERAPTSPRRPASTPGSSTRSRRSKSSARTPGGAAAAADRGHRCGPPSRPGSPTPRSPSICGIARGPGARAAARARRPAGLPHGRHLRGRVRGPHALPVLHLRRADRGARPGTGPR